MESDWLREKKKEKRKSGQNDTEVMQEGNYVHDPGRWVGQSAH